MDAMESGERSAQDLVGLVRRRWRALVALVVVGAVVGALVSMLQVPYYSAEAQVLIQNRAQVDEPGRAMDPEEVATQADVVTSDAVTRRVIDDLDLSTTPDDLLDRVSVRPVDEKRVLAIEATWTDADVAADLANSLSGAYIALADERAKAAQEALTDSYVERLSEISSQLEELRGQLPDATRTEAEDLRAQVQSLVARQGELQASLLLAEEPSTFTSGGVVLREAEAPVNASSARPLRAALLGAVIALVLGLGLVYLRDRQDDRIRGGRPLPADLDDVPVLGQIPVENARTQGRVAGLVESQSPVAEAYRGLHTSVRFLLAAHRPRGAHGDEHSRGGMMMIGSTHPAEGKTSVATNLAVAAARSGRRVILVDADLRAPGVSTRFGIDVPTGLTDVLRESEAPNDYLVDVGIDGLRILPAGSVPPNPAELLASPRCAQLWESLRRDADLVIVDSPPMLRVSDGMEVAGRADIVVLVTREHKSRARHVAVVRRRLHQIGVPISGLVITGVPLKRSEFQYGYGQQQTEVATEEALR
jgi:capsular exopolysaccharide synthesis family protein